MKNRLILIFLLLGAVCRGQNLIPQPNHIEKRTGSFLVNRDTYLVSHDFPDLAAYLNDHIERACGYRLQQDSHPHVYNRISIEKQAGLPAEGYSLDVSASQTVIRAHGRGGAFYAIQTLLQLLPPSVYDTTARQAGEVLEIPCLRIDDAPRYGYRGVMLDVSRTFSDKQAVMRYIDWMARHKVNRLHWHLSDDNGWRIEIKKYPELTSRGAWRGPGEALPPQYGSGQKRYGGFYTQDDIREIVRYAAFRNVEIIPEIDLPGHSQTLTSVYPETFCRTDTPTKYEPEEMCNVLCASREENYEMLRDIFSEIAELFPSRYIHIGGDEVSPKYWQNCPDCRALMKAKGMKKAAELEPYFIRRLEHIIHGLGKECGAWNEAIEGEGARPGTLIYGWKDTDVCVKAVRRGFPVVMVPASYCYIDMKQHAWDRGHTWAWLVDTRRVYSFDPADTGLTASEQEKVRGVEVALWAELLDRPDRFAEYQGYPRICALAEMGWTEGGRRDWEDFYGRLTGSHLDRLGAMGIRFRMFPPEARYDSGTITVTPVSPQDTVRYTTDLSEPDASSPVYTEPMATDRPETYRFRSFSRGGYSTAVWPIAERKLVLGPGEQQTVTLPLDGFAARNGFLLLSIGQLQDKATINRMEVAGADTSYLIIRNGQKVNPFSDLRIYLDEKSRSAVLKVTLTNGSPKTDELTLGLRPSPYIEPSVTVTSSLAPSPKFPVRNAADYHFGTYVRVPSPCKAGDYILYKFDEPVDCGAIDVRTGIPNVTRYIVTQGTVEYSADGINFGGSVPLDDSGTAVIRPDGPVRAVRVSIAGSNGETTVCWQDLRVIPKD